MLSYHLKQGHRFENIISDEFLGILDRVVNMGMCRKIDYQIGFLDIFLYDPPIPHIAIDMLNSFHPIEIEDILPVDIRNLAIAMIQ
jgi:hypothetical protein